MEPRLAITLVKSRRVRGALATAALLIVLLPVLVAAAVTGLAAQQEEETCGAAGLMNVPAGGGAVAAGQYAAPLELQPGRSYEVGATEYGGPGDPTSGSYGSIPNPGQSYLPAHPDTFAELSVLRVNPANGGSFTFADADALSRLPYLTPLRVALGGRSELLFKRDTGYGQGPGQFIENGQPYRLDVWWQAAQSLGVTKSAVQVQLAPATGSAGTLQALPEPAERGTGETQRTRAARSHRRRRQHPAAVDAGNPDEDPSQRPGRRRRTGSRAPSRTWSPRATGSTAPPTSTAARTAPRSTPCSPPMTAHPPSPTCCTGAACSARARLTQRGSAATASRDQDGG